MDTCMFMAESFCCEPEIMTTLLISCIPKQNKKLKKKERKTSHHKRKNRKRKEYRRNTTGKQGLKWQ